MESKLASIAADEQADRAQELSSIVDTVADISRDTQDQTSEVSATAQKVTSSTENVSQMAKDLDAEARELSDIMESFSVSHAEAVTVGVTD